MMQKIYKTDDEWKRELSKELIQPARGIASTPRRWTLKNSEQGSGNNGHGTRSNEQRIGNAGNFELYERDKLYNFLLST